MKSILLTLFVISALPLAAQTCLEVAIQKGQTAYNQGNYAKARAYWETGKECAPTDTKKLNNLIWKTRDADNDGTVNGRDNCPDSPGTQANKGCPPVIKSDPPPPSDRDKDGILDASDQCPDVPGTIALHGCPDFKDDDEDGTPNAQDECPMVYGPRQYKGCPDRDFDEIPDIKDACPDQFGPKNTAGCPDRDADGIADQDDKCPDAPGIKTLAGCPDRDNDGVVDASDDCPETPGLKRFNGCPDRDFDETPDAKDGCPDTPGPKTAYGCPDRDADGVADKDDKCPDQPGVAANKGCPIVAPEGFVFIQGAEFTMGDPFNEGESDEKPTHSVTLSDFYLGKTEVTFDEFDAFCTATGREKPSDSGWGRVRRPVINVDWYDAVEYCNWLSQKENLTPVYIMDKNRQDPNNSNTSDTKKWLVTTNAQAKGYRLPTEAEWEYAAREGGKKVRFGNGKDIANPAQINFNASESYKKDYSIVGEYRGKTVPVDEMPEAANSLGLRHMSGNVWEWCSDWYGEKYYAESADVRNPAGSDSVQYRVLRGGSWNFDPDLCRAAYRGRNDPNIRADIIGFRVARGY